MGIDPKVEKPTRTMLGHAMRGEQDKLSAAIYAVGDETFRGSVGLCLATAGYVAIDVSGRWPTDADVRQIAHNVAAAETRLNLKESDIYEFISRAALGSEPLDEVFSTAEAAFTLPILITASLLPTFCPRGKDWWEYLDTIEAALETARGVDLSVLPALMLRSRRPAS